MVSYLHETRFTGYRLVYFLLTSERRSASACGRKYFDPHKQKNIHPIYCFQNNYFEGPKKSRTLTSNTSKQFVCKNVNRGETTKKHSQTRWSSLPQRLWLVYRY